MITMPNLQAALLDLLFEVKDAELQLIIGGGYGIYLKFDYVRHGQLRTLLQEWPEPRSTNDIDLFLRPELLADSTRLKPLAEAITSLGYLVVPGAESYQFAKPGPGGTIEGSIKIDFLTAPQYRFEGKPVKVDNRRVRPRPSVGIHAHPVDEAPTLEDGLLSCTLAGDLSSGEPWEDEVFLPNPYTFSMMKLFAFKDRLDDAEKEFGRYHALDLYTILATTTEEEWGNALRLRELHQEQPSVEEAGQIVSEHFSAMNSIGMIRLRESPYYHDGLQLAEFMSALRELFPIPSVLSDRKVRA